MIFYVNEDYLQFEHISTVIIYIEPSKIFVFIKELFLSIPTHFYIGKDLFAYYAQPPLFLKMNSNIL